MVIALSGWSPDRYPQVLSMMLQEAGLPPVRGKFSFSGFEPDGQVTPEQEAAISSYFRPMSLDECRAAKRSEIAAARWNEMVQPTTVQGYESIWFADKESMNDMLRASNDLQTTIALGYLSSDVEVNWKTANGSFVSLSVNDLVTIRLLLSQRQQTLYNKEADLVFDIENANTVEDLNKILW